MEIEKYILNSYPTVGPYTAVSTLEKKISKKGYVVISDNDNKFYGILTTCDLVKRPHKLVIDCLTEKEKLYTSDTIFSILDKFDNNQCSALPVFIEDKFIGIIERQNAVVALKAKIQELYDKSIISEKVKQSFLNNLSHEVRTPLNGLLGFIELISDLNTENNYTEQKEYYETIRKSADRLLLIFNDLIDLALINSGDKLETKIEAINIERIFLELKEYFELTILASGKNISVNYANPNSSLVLLTDGKKIKHILYHLIDNAIKFSFNNDKVIYGYKIEKENIIFFVKNNGYKISKEKKETIFDLFERQNYHNDKYVEGLGIGLPLVKKLALLLEGKIELVTNESQITFTCSIPLKTKNSEHTVKINSPAGIS